MAPRLNKDFGAGLRLSKTDIEDHPSGPPQRQGLSQTERMFQVGSTFLSGVLAYEYPFLDAKPDSY